MFSFAILVFLFLLWLLPLEWASRYWEKNFGDPLDQAKAILRLDPYLGWRQRSNVHGSFLGIPLDTNEIGLRSPPLPSSDNAGYRILILGPSSSFGWGVPETMTYARQLESLLGKRGLGFSISVINAGEIGFSSRQGLEFYRRELKRIRPQLTIIAYGANDVDRYRFFLDNPSPDAVALSKEQNPSVVFLNNLAGRLSLFRIAPRALLRLGSFLSCGDRGIRNLRVPPQDYLDNLRQLVSQLKQDHSKVILMTTGYKLPSYPRVSLAQAQKSRVLLRAGIEQLEEGKREQAIVSLSNSIAENPNQCEVYYYLSRCLAAARQCSKARTAFETARKFEPHRIEKDLRLYNQLVRTVAKQEKAPLVDVEKLLKQNEAKQVFVDPIHPSPRGHFLIAQALLQEMAGGDLFSRKIRASRSQDHVDQR